MVLKQMRLLYMFRNFQFHTVRVAYACIMRITSNIVTKTDLCCRKRTMIFLDTTPVLWEREKLVFSIIKVLYITACISSVTCTNCVYWVSDPDGMTMNQVVARAGVNFSLHGAWDIDPDQPQMCISHDKFLGEFYWYQSEGALVHFMDASPRTKFSCCHLQWHEYSKHGCFKKVSYEKWKSEIFKCISIFDTVLKYPHQYRYDHKKTCNHIETLTTVSVQRVGRKPEKPICKPDINIQFSENMYQLTDTCDVIKMFNPGKSIKLSFKDEHHQSIIPVCLSGKNETSYESGIHGEAERDFISKSKPPISGPDEIWEEIHKVLKKSFTLDEIDSIKDVDCAPFTNKEIAHDVEKKIKTRGFALKRRNLLKLNDKSLMQAVLDPKIEWLCRFRTVSEQLKVFIKESWDLLPKVISKNIEMQSDQPFGILDDPCYFKLYFNDEDYECWTLKDLVYMQDLFLMTSL